jgi:site-specific DNA recombinase
MLTVAYVRVSTEDQATEGFSIEGQAEKLRGYATLHDLGEVTVIEDPGWSGKNMERPGLQQLLTMVSQGHVTNVLVWRLDRLSRSLGDLILLADQLGTANVALHSFCERIDLSSATGRMFYNVLGSFAQFYREQLAENVRMGMAQAVREGKWINRPKTGYDLVAGELVANDMAPVVRMIFRMRADGKSQGDIARASGVGYSTVCTILRSRIYLGEVQLRDEWFPGRHEPIVTPEEFAAAHRGRVKGRRRGKDLLSGRIRCGLCGRSMSMEDNGSGHLHYRCRHRGQGCALPRRSSRGLLRGAVLGPGLLGHDDELREAIRQQLAEPAGASTSGRKPVAESAKALAVLVEERRKLLRLHYADQIDAELFAEEQARLTAQIEALRSEESAIAEDVMRVEQVGQGFEAIAAYLAEIDVPAIWEAATEQERRVLIDELLDRVEVHEDHLEVVVRGAPRLNVTLGEVGLAGPGGEKRLCRRADETGSRLAAPAMDARVVESVCEFRAQAFLLGQRCQRNARYATRISSAERARCVGATICGTSAAHSPSDRYASASDRSSSGDRCMRRKSRRERLVWFGIGCAACLRGPADQSRRNGSQPDRSPFSAIRHDFLLGRNRMQHHRRSLSSGRRASPHVGHRRNDDGLLDTTHSARKRPRGRARVARKPSGQRQGADDHASRHRDHCRIERLRRPRGVAAEWSSGYASASRCRRSNSRPHRSPTNVGVPYGAWNGCCDPSKWCSTSAPVTASRHRTETVRLISPAG